MKENTTVYQMIYLASCAINKQIADKSKIENIDMQKLYELCQKHMITALVQTALEHAGVVMENEWKETKAKAIRKELLFDAEREKLFGFMETNGIWYLPLKGVVLKQYYPGIGLRQMSDNDILYDSSFQKLLCQYMKAQGYQPEGIGQGNHDVYKKPPVFNFEMHTSLYGRNHDKKWIDYYANVKERLILEKGKKYGYRFCEEDFYVYIITHEWKHYDDGGTGIRSLIDIYIYLKNWESKLDWEYITGECAKLGIADFEKKGRILSKKVLSQPGKLELSEEEQEMLAEYLNAGVYGTQRKSFQHRIRKYREKTGNTSGFSYVLARIFPDMEVYKEWYPFFYKHKLLLPVGWLFRLVRGITVRRRKVKEEWNVLRELEKDSPM